MRKSKDRRAIRKAIRVLRKGLKRDDSVQVRHKVNDEERIFPAIVEQPGRTRGKVQAVIRDYEKPDRIMRSWYNIGLDGSTEQGFTLTQHFVHWRIPVINRRIYFYTDNEVVGKENPEYTSLDKRLKEAGL